ncbi:hypothetical protein AB0E69_15255 [Kribbella sp. NPDC026611]|uniref:hypothetical protein n=1 Tax=Kribbella sp. NPDC026611 TaxID=3154911 RepID=UPI0033EAACC6
MANEPADSIAAATTAKTFAVLLQAATAMKNAAQLELDTTGQSLQREGPLWSQTGAAVNTLANSFQSASGALMQGWTSKREAPVFESASSATQKALHDSASAVDGSEGRGTIEQMCIETVHYMNSSLNAATQAEEQVRAAAAAYLATRPTGTSYQGMGGPLGRGPDPAAVAAFVAAEAAAVEAVRPVVLHVGNLLSTQNTVYSSIGQQILAAAQGLQWVGPNGQARAGTGGDTGGNAGSRAGDTSAGDTGDQTGTAGDQAGADQTGAGAGGDAGGGAGGGAGGDQGGDQSGQVPGAGQLPGGGSSALPPGSPGHGTGLAGLPAMPALTPPMGDSMMPLPSATIPPVPPMADVPALPVGGVGGLGGIGSGGSGGIGGIGGGSGGIGGGIGKGDLGKSAVGLGKADQQIAQAARLQPAAPPSAGQAPATPAGLTGGTGAAGAAGGGIPPMMPPMGAGAGAEGGSRRSGSGAIRPVGRERRRTNGSTPGVPEALQGRASKASFQAKPARREKEQAATLEVLDEDLWTVEASEPAAAPKQVRHPAH